MGFGESRAPRRGAAVSWGAGLFPNPACLGRGGPGLLKVARRMSVWAVSLELPWVLLLAAAAPRPRPAAGVWVRGFAARGGGQPAQGVRGGSGLGPAPRSPGAVVKPGHLLALWSSGEAWAHCPSWKYVSGSGLCGEGPL